MEVKQKFKTDELVRAAHKITFFSGGDTKKLDL